MPSEYETGINFRETFTSSATVDNLFTSNILKSRGLIVSVMMNVQVSFVIFYNDAYLS